MKRSEREHKATYVLGINYCDPGPLDLVNLRALVARLATTVGQPDIKLKMGKIRLQRNNMKIDELRKQSISHPESLSR